MQCVLKMVTIQLGTTDDRNNVHITKVDTWFCGVVKKPGVYFRQKQLLKENRYPADVLLSRIDQKLATFAAEKIHLVQRSSWYT